MDVDLAAAEARGARSSPGGDTPGRWSTVVTVLAVASTLLVVVGIGSMAWRGRPVEVLYARWMFHNAPAALLTGWLGAAILRRQPSHGLGRLLLAMGLASAVHVATISLADWRLVAVGAADGVSLVLAPADLPLAASLPLWVSAWIWVLPAGCSATLMLLWFPDGRLPGPRWGPVVWLTAAGVGMMATAYMVAVWPWSTRVVEVAGQPLGAPAPRMLSTLGGSLLLVAAVASVASLRVRWQVATSVQRQQLRAVLVTGAISAAAITLLWPWQRLWVPAVAVALAAFLAAYGVAVLRFRLHDLDVAINRTVAASLLAVLVTGVYVAVVVGLGSVIGRRAADRPLLPLVAVVLIAVLFEPARRRVRRFVDRALYGRDADAYSVLAALSHQLRDTGSVDEVADRVTELLVRSTGANGAAVVMTWASEPRTLSTGGAVSGAPTRSADIVHDGDVLGAVHLYARSGSDLAPDAPSLLQDVAGTLGAVLRNAALTDELREQVEALRRSRERLVTAQDAARRALERDLHDGAQAQLVALRLQLGLAAHQAAAAGADDDAAVALSATLERLGHDTDAAIRSLRDLSRGLHPPLLATGGIAAALRAAARGLPVDVEVLGEVGRLHPTLEAGVYFCCLEAVKNAATHAAAQHVRVTLVTDGGRLRFTVEDDGVGFDPDDTAPGRGLTNLEDRVAGLGGEVTIDTAPSRGTVVTGAVPVQPLVSER